MRGLHIHEIRRAREIRREQTAAEERLWRRLRGRKLKASNLFGKHLLALISAISFAAKGSLLSNLMKRHAQRTLKFDMAKGAPLIWRIKDIASSALQMSKCSKPLTASLKPFSCVRAGNDIVANHLAPHPSPLPASGERGYAYFSESNISLR
jgi:hypothetical protein